MTEPTLVALIDSMFPGQYCIHANGDNAGRKPLRLEWVRMPVHRVSHPWSVVVTDGQFSVSFSPDTKRVIGWLLEPLALHPENYDQALTYADDLYAVLTHDVSFAQAIGQKAILVPSGGTRVHPSDWGVHAKLDNGIPPSIVDSGKRSLEGHALRGYVIDNTPHSKLHRYGPPHASGYLTSKIEALRRYPYSLAFENVQRDNWFTEALLDCFLTGTVPIYWGAKNLEAWGFDMRGVVIAHNGDEVIDKLVHSSYTYEYWEYLRDEGVLHRNLVNALRFQMIEDFVVLTYPTLFG